MARRKKYGFWIDVAQADLLKAVKVRDGIPESEQVQRAIAEWLVGKGVANPHDRRRTAKRSTLPIRPGLER